MDKTTSTSSSSVAAVADSASAAAASKTTGLGSNATASATSVKLLIKASNQQFDDQIIESDLLWTVQRLKTQLSLVYPNKPPVAEQKLIYSGQLLSDKLQLKDVIRSYKDVYTHNHIFHLVCTSKYVMKTSGSGSASQQTKMNSSASTSNAAPSSSSNGSTTETTTDGLRQRHVTGNNVQQQQQQQQQQAFAQWQERPDYASIAQSQMFAQWLAAAATQMQAVGPCPSNDAASGADNDAIRLMRQYNMQATHQVAMQTWMQQVYSQYMDQCLRLMSMNANAIPQMNASTLGAGGMESMPATGSTAIGGGNPFQQHMPFGVNAAGTTPMAANNVHPVIPSFVSATQPPVAEAGAGEMAPAAQPAEPIAQAEPQIVAPRFPNIVHEEADNRDWLDRFFSITRLAIFLTILYFNSSPLRCLFVIIIGGGIYLYHIGVLRIRRERNNNNINRNNNAAAEADQIRQGVQQVQQAQAAQEQQQQPQAPLADADAPNDATDSAAAATTEETTSTSTDENATLLAGDDRENTANSVISFVRTFVVTFFTSLLPETAAL